MKKVLLLLFLIPFCGSGQEISGNWSWQAENGEAQMDITLDAEGSKYTGHHCAVFQNGDKIDCVDENDPVSISIQRTAENEFEGTIRSGYSASEGNIKLHFDPKDKTLLFELSEAPDGIYYLPKKAIFKSTVRPGTRFELFKDNIEKQEAAIYSMLIDKMAKPFPLPPPPPKDGSKPNPVNWDSISKVKVEVVVDTIMFHISEKKLYLEKEYSEFQNLVDNISSLPAKPVETKYINSEKGHRLIFGNSLEDSDTKYSQIVSISRIAFNEEKNMAALYAGHSTHPLASYLNLYLLKKVTGRWQIVFKKTIEVS